MPDAPDHVIHSAMRYALGRRSYIVSQTVRYIVSILDELDNQMLVNMHSDIRRRWEKDRLGSDMDKQEWLTLAKEIEDRVEVPFSIQ